MLVLHSFQQEISLNIILASTSKIRGKILSAAGIRFSVLDSELDEAVAKSSLVKLSPRKMSLQLAKLKAEKVSSQHPEAITIGADQVLGFKNRSFDKPVSRADAESQLSMLRNATHTLHSAVSCAIAGAEVWNHCSEARLTMRDFTADFLTSYLDDSPADYLSSVGAYKLEETGIQLFEKIEGDYFAILGLPLLPLLAFLRERKIIAS
ncbi:MAG TPA: Maf family protein [Aestuariivirga sp.]|nr:Maf family protein [Aestuariivirga sp.]